MRGKRRKWESIVGLGREGRIGWSRGGRKRRRLERLGRGDGRIGYVR